MLGYPSIGKTTPESNTVITAMEFPVVNETGLDVTLLLLLLLVVMLLLSLVNNVEVEVEALDAIAFKAISLI